MEVKTFNQIEAKTDRMIMAIAKNYISDGYHFVFYQNNDKIGYIEVYLRNEKNEIRISSIIIEGKIEVYKNRKLNNTIKVSA